MQASWFAAAAVVGTGCQTHSVAESMDCSNYQKQSVVAELLIAAVCNWAVAAGTVIGQTLSVEVEIHSGSRWAVSMHY